MPDNSTTAPDRTQIQVRAAGRMRRIGNGRLDRAARELNMLSVSSAKLKNVATVGAFIKQIGLLKYGNGRLLGSAQLIAQGAQACSELALREGLSDEVRQGYLELQLRFVKALDDNVALQLEVNKTDGRPEGASDIPQGKSFLPGAQVAPIQINVHGGSVETKEQPCKTS